MDDVRYNKSLHWHPLARQLEHPVAIHISCVVCGNIITNYSRKYRDIINLTNGHGA